ncbi:MAG: hypothetical protein WBA22_10515 [Candidatus Methanofastidiosia archaeon]
MPEKKRDLDKEILEALATAPEIKGLTITQLSEIVDAPWPTTRWHLELLNARGDIKYINLGRAKVYSLKRK